MMGILGPDPQFLDKAMRQSRSAMLFKSNPTLQAFTELSHASPFISTIQTTRVAIERIDIVYKESLPRKLRITWGSKSAGSGGEVSIAKVKGISSAIHFRIMLDATYLPVDKGFSTRQHTVKRKVYHNNSTLRLLLDIFTNRHHQIAACPCVSNGRPKDISPTSTHIAALTYIGTAVNPVCEAIKLAHSPPNLNNVAAVPVPVPRCGPGNDSGVNAYMMAYSGCVNTNLNGRTIIPTYQSSQASQ